MATTYNDIIKRRAGRAAYSLEEEKAGQWESFIPNEQFNAVLKTVLRSVRANDIDAHKSFWINGTYGTGKSHAAAVITHLLSDPVDDIRGWVDYEYGDPKFNALRSAIYDVREKKRLLPVKIEGLAAMSSVGDLPLVLQSAVIKALNDHGIEIVVDTDYDTLLRNIEEFPVFWDEMIAKNSGLYSVAPDRAMLIHKLQIRDMGTFQKANAALHEGNIHVFLNQNNISEWLVEVQEKLREVSPYIGLLILWDEFTDVMEDSIGIQVLKALQTIVQKFANEENDSYFCLISHPSAFNKLGIEETKQTDGRYHRMKYNMEPVSAFKIMSRKFEIIDPDRHEQMRNYFYTVNSRLLDIFTRSSNDPQETRNDLLQLFPLHPGTANLATHYATVVGSSSRSVFEFIGQNEAMESFLESEEDFANRHLVTADYLWDFVLNVFKDDVANYAAVTERFSTYNEHVKNHSKAAYAVFKGVLLLNAFNNISGDSDNVGSLVVPNTDNIIDLFTGTQYESEVEEVLDWFNEQGIIQRDPTGVFSVQFSALPSHEIEEIKSNLMDGDYRFISKVLNFGDTARNHVDKKYLQKIIRPYRFEFYSEANNDYMLRDSIKKAKKDTRPSDLFMAMMFARNNEEVAHMRKFAEEASEEVKDDKELADIIYIVFDTPFGEKEYIRFIEYMANYTAAQNHGFLEQVNVHRDNATTMIKDWLTRTQRGNATIYINGATISMSLKHLSSMLNDIIAPKIFSLGPDAVEKLRKHSPQTFWKPQVSKEVVRKMVFATSKTDLLEQLNGQIAPIKHLLEDALDDNLEWRADIPENHPVKAVYDFINNRIKNANKSVIFNFAEKFDELRYAPYGLAGNYASAALVAFALRKWAGKIFDKLGKPRDNNNLVDDIAELISVWEKGKSSNKLEFKFQTPEEGKLCKSLVKLFKLDKLKGYSDISSLKDARFAITGAFLEEMGYPLWVIKYVDDDFANSNPAVTINGDIRQLIDDIVDICAERDLKNPALVNEALTLMDNYKVDLPDIFKKEGIFERGFNNFLLSQPTVQLQEEEIDDAYTYIKQHLESTVGYWSEDEVANALLRWRIAENDRIEQERREREERERREREAAEQARREEERKKYAEFIKEAKEFKGDERQVQKKKVSVREYIDSINDPSELRRLLDAVIDLGYEGILNTILSTGIVANNPEHNA